METPFTTLLTKGETESQRAPGFFQDTTMRCVKREETRSPAITVWYEKKKTALSSQKLLQSVGWVFFTVHASAEIQLTSKHSTKMNPNNIIAALISAI